MFGLLSCCLSGQAVAPTGTLRVAFIATNPMQGHVDAATGAISGPVRELSDALGKKLGVPVAITPMANVTLIIDGLKVHTVDVGFVAVEAARATQVDFSQAYLLGWSSYLVRADSPMRRVADLDAAGVRIGANAGDSQEIYLSRTLKRATMLRLTPANDWPTMLASGQIDAYAANRVRLLQAAAANPRLRVIDDNYLAVEQALAVAKGSSEALQEINRFLEEIKTSGMVRGMIDRAGLTGSADPAPTQAK